MEANDADTRAARLTDLAQPYHDIAPALYLTAQVTLYGVSRKVEGFTVANRVPVYENISVRKK
jgi:hypothetical protein